MNGKSLVVLDGSGFIGRCVIQEAVRSGWRVNALARSDQSASIVVAAGASVLKGDAEYPVNWFGEVCGADAIITCSSPHARSGMAAARCARFPCSGKIHPGVGRSATDADRRSTPALDLRERHRRSRAGPRRCLFGELEIENERVGASTRSVFRSVKSSNGLASRPRSSILDQSMVQVARSEVPFSQRWRRESGRTSAGPWAA